MEENPLSFISLFIHQGDEVFKYDLKDDTFKNESVKNESLKLENSKVSKFENTNRVENAKIEPVLSENISNNQIQPALPSPPKGKRKKSKEEKNDKNEKANKKPRRSHAEIAEARYNT
jgi:hypothetical protein